MTIFLLMDSRAVKLIQRRLNWCIQSWAWATKENLLDLSNELAKDKWLAGTAYAADWICFCVFDFVVSFFCDESCWLNFFVWLFFFRFGCWWPNGPFAKHGLNLKTIGKHGLKKNLKCRQAETEWVTFNNARPDSERALVIQLHLQRTRFVAVVIGIEIIQFVFFMFHAAPMVGTRRLCTRWGDWKCFAVLFWFWFLVLFVRKFIRFSFSSDHFSKTNRSIIAQQGNALKLSQSLIWKNHNKFQLKAIW